MKFERHLKGAMNLNYGFGGIVMYFPKMKPWLAASLALLGQWTLVRITFPSSWLDNPPKMVGVSGSIKATKRTYKISRCFRKS